MVQVKYVVGLDGFPLTRANLPPANTGRWTHRRKAELTLAIVGGLLSIEEAGKLYKLTTEELLSWQAKLNQYGPPSLRVNQLRHLRSLAKAA